VDLTQVRYSPILTNLGIAFQNDMFVVDQLFPTVPSRYDTGYYFSKNRESFLLTQAYRRPGAEANTVEHSYSKTLYATQGYALKEVIDDLIKDNAVDPLRPIMDANECIVEKLKLQKENDGLTLISDYTTTFASYSQALSAYGSGTNEDYVYIDDYTNCDPSRILGLMKQRIQLACGKMPNVMVINPKIETILATHPNVRDNFKYVMAMNNTQLPDTFCDLKVIRARAIKDSENEGDIATPTSAYLFPDVIFVGVVGSGAGLWKPTVGVNFEHQPLRVKEWYDMKINSTCIQAEMNYVLKIISPSFGMVAYSLLTP
jgi:hypothetical protein